MRIRTHPPPGKYVRKRLAWIARGYEHVNPLVAITDQPACLTDRSASGFVTVVLVAYVGHAVIYLPYLHRALSIGLADSVSPLWPVVPATAIGYFLTCSLSNFSGATFFTLVVRLLVTSFIVAIAHGVFRHIRCIREAGGMITTKLVREVLIS
jgi:hypothetical protein